MLDKAEPHLLLDVRPLVEVDICSLPFSLSILLEMTVQKHCVLLSVFPVARISCCLCFLLPVFLMLLLPDIPLSQLEAKNSDDIHLLRERISHLKHQIAGISQPPGKMLKTAIFSIIAK